MMYAKGGYALKSSDAHDPSWVGIFDKAVDLIEEEGFDEDLILNTSVEKIMKFLNLKRM